jgi:hypothetical protein
LQIAIVVVSSWFALSWHLDGEGKGLSQHLAAWVILAVDPLLLLAGGFLQRQFIVAMVTLPLRSSADIKYVRDLTRDWRRVIRADGKYQFAYYACIICGLLGWLLNLKQTSNPTMTYHHDVFDSISHLPSFIAFKVALFISWGIVYPTVGFLVISTAFATWRILSACERKNLIEPVMKHPDQCYGLRNVGTLNIAVLAPFFLVILSTYSIFETHKTLYASIIIPIAVIAILFIWVSFIIIRPIYSFLNNARQKAYSDLVARMGNDVNGSRLLRFSLDRLIFATANASPYSNTTKAMLIAMRGASAVPLALKLFR